MTLEISNRDMQKRQTAGGLQGLLSLDAFKELSKKTSWIWTLSRWLSSRNKVFVSQRKMVYII